MVLVGSLSDLDTTAYLTSAGVPSQLTAALEALGDEVERRGGHVRAPLRIIAQHLKDAKWKQTRDDGERWLGKRPRGDRFVQKRSGRAC